MGINHWMLVFTALVLQLRPEPVLLKQFGHSNCRIDENELGKLSDKLSTSILRVQEPQHCKTAKKLICSVNFHPLGFNNMLHMLVTCHMLAYGLGRVLVVTNLDFWSQEGDLQQWFLPFLKPECGFKRKLKIDDFSSVKSLYSPDFVKDFETVKNDEDIIKYEFDFKGIRAPFPYPPGVMPKKLKDAVKKYHRHPVHWYIGHFFKYHLRLNANFSSLLDHIKKNIGFRHPIVGIHVRQGDKVGDEMNFVPEDNFINKARHYFVKNNIPRKERRIFVATDTSRVLQYYKGTYFREFDFVHVNSIDRDGSGAYYKKHYKGDHLTSLLIEMMLLMQCDYNVVTFSSYVAKVVYLARQGLSRTDASELVVSLDRRWFFTAPGYQYGPEFLRYCLFMKHGKSLSDSPQISRFEYKAGDYCRVHSRERTLVIGNKTEKVLFVTHDRTKVIGIVHADDVIPYPRQPPFADDEAFSSL